MADSLLEVRDLRTYIYTRRGVVKAVDGATFSVRRGETLGIRQQEFVSLARIAGCSGLTIMFRHIVPNLAPSILVLATLHVGYVIVLEAALSFLGVGIPPPTPTWGNMLSDALNSGLVPPWWLVLFPGVAITITVLAFNLLGDGIRDLLDPRLRRAV